MTVSLALSTCVFFYLFINFIFWLLKAFYWLFSFFFIHVHYAGNHDLSVMCCDVDLTFHLVVYKPYHINIMLFFHRFIDWQHSLLCGRIIISFFFGLTGLFVRALSLYFVICFHRRCTQNLFRRGVSFQVLSNGSICWKLSYELNVMLWRLMKLFQTNLNMYVVQHNFPIDKRWISYLYSSHITRVIKCGRLVSGIKSEIQELALVKQIQSWISNVRRCEKGGKSVPRQIVSPYSTLPPEYGAVCTLLCRCKRRSKCSGIVSSYVSSINNYNAVSMTTNSLQQ